MRISKITAVALGALAIATCLEPAIAFFGISQRTASAQPVHYWRFEETLGFLVDSIGSANLTAQNIEQVALPSNGRGVHFPMNIPSVGANAFAANSLSSPAGLTTSNSTPMTDAFTIELNVHLEDLSLSSTNTRAVVAVQAVVPSDPSQFSWAFAVEKQGANFSGRTSSPGELELFASDGSRFELIPSGIFIAANTDYYLSAAFDLNADVRFYVKDLATGQVQTANVAHSLTSLNPESIMKIVSPTEFGFVDGVLDEVRLSRGVLPAGELLVNLVPEPATATIVLTMLASALVGAVWHRRFR